MEITDDDKNTETGEIKLNNENAHANPTDQQQTLTTSVSGTTATSGTTSMESETGTGIDVSTKPPSIAQGTFKMPMLTPKLSVKKSGGSVVNALNIPEAELTPDKALSEKHEKDKQLTVSDDSKRKSVTSDSGSKRLKSDSKLSPAEQMKQNQIPIPYKEPPWASVAPKPYAFEVIKNGTVVDTIKLNDKSFYVFGRLASCDITMEHPSLSRYHAVVQYCGTQGQHDIGWYLYDLDSTHGTWINKFKVKPRIYTRLRVGYVVKLGGSTRLNVLQVSDNTVCI